VKTMQTHEDRDVSLIAVQQYMREVRQVRRLTKEEEAVLVERVHRGKVEQAQTTPNQWVLMLAKDARDRLIQDYQGFVAKVAAQYHGNRQGMSFLDLVQEGNVGLLRALDGGDFENARQLYALVKVCVRGEMVTALRLSGPKLHVSRGVIDAFYAMYVVKRELVVRLGREPRVSEVAQQMGIEERKLLEVIGTMHRAEVVESIQQMNTWDGEEQEDCGNFAELYQSPSTQETEQSFQLEQRVRQAMERVLSDRQREVVQLRYGVGGGTGGGYTQMEVARLFGVTDRAVGQMERKAKRLLREALASCCGVDQESVA